MVENIGDSLIEAAFSYAPSTEYQNISGYFCIENNNVSIIAIDTSEKQAVQFVLSGKPDHEITHAVLGTITVTIKLPE